MSGSSIERFKKNFNKIQIKHGDPILSTTYNKYYLSDAIEKKKFMTELDVCCIHIKDLKIKGLPEKRLAQLQMKLLRKNLPISDVSSNVSNFKKPSERSTLCALILIETILFELDNTLLYAVYKKNHVMTYDTSTFVKLIG